MAKRSSHILDMARKGAEHKYEELKSEIAGLMKHFPHLASVKGKQASRAAADAFSRGRKVVGAAIAGEPVKTKRRKRTASAVSPRRATRRG